MNSFAFETLPEFDKHRFIVFLHDEKSALKGFIAIHRGGLDKPAFGATRLWEYESEVQAIKDVLNLSRMMSYKSALANLPYGGAKAVIINPRAGNDPERRKALLKEYAKRVNYLRGSFITGTDVGLDQKDLKIMSKESPYMVGSGVNPEYFTGLGLFFSTQVCLEEVFGSSQLQGRSFAIQGLGKVGTEFLELIYKDSGKIFASDIDKVKVRRAKRLFPRLQIVTPAETHTQKVDVFAPCALSDALTREKVHEMHAKIISGGANNQLANEGVGELLYNMGILYAPDYVVNAGGLMSVADEFEYSDSSTARVTKKVSKIRDTLRKIFSKSKKAHRATNLVADGMAENIFNNR